MQGFYFGFCKLHVGLGFPGGQGVGSPPPSKDAVFAKADVSLIDTAEQSPRSSKTASEILIFIKQYPSCRGIISLEFLGLKSPANFLVQATDPAVFFLIFGH
jgi:hypothetical protein